MLTRRNAMMASLLALGAAPVAGPAVAQAAGPHLTRTSKGHGGTPTPAGYWHLLDDFGSGFTTGPEGHWTVFATGDLPQGDGIPTTSNGWLRVVPTGTNPANGRPAFAYTTGQEDDGGAGLSDHLKWFALANHQASTGFLGFDAVAGEVLTYEGVMSARTYGTAGHPFGSAVRDPRADIRLAAAAFNTADFESYMVFDFFLTDSVLYAFYERLPRPGSTYASFSYALPVARRFPGQVHHLAISLDRAAGVVTWLADGRQVLRVDRIGYLPADRSNLIIHLGGTEELVEVRQLACGMGLFTLMDAQQPQLAGPALVRLSSETSYYRPRQVIPTPQRFVDEESLAASRLWGQGAELTVSRQIVHSRPSR